jgi:hypothetical protein
MLLCTLSMGHFIGCLGAINTTSVDELYRMQYRLASKGRVKRWKIKNLHFRLAALQNIQYKKIIFFPLWDRKNLLEPTVISLNGNLFLSV